MAISALKDEVSIFIPTHNRKQLLIRNLNWLRNSPYKIYVADSSDFENRSHAEIAELNGSKDSSWIYYFHDPGRNYYEKMVSVLSNVTTPYVVVCPDDDFIFWQNIPEFYEIACRHGATTVCGRNLKYSSDGVSHKFSEEGRYRKFSIRNHNSKLDHLLAGMNPVVCTYYQFYKVSSLLDIWKHLNNLKAYMPGTKFAEIIFKSSCFINGPVYHCDKILRIVGDILPLRKFDQSLAVQENNINAQEEAEVIRKKRLIVPIVFAHSTFLANHLDISVEKAKKIVLRIINRNVEMFLIRHASLWNQPYELAFSNARSSDRTFRSPNGVNLRHEFGLRDKTFREPRWAHNLDDYFLKDSKEWDSLLELISFLNSSLV